MPPDPTPGSAATRAALLAAARAQFSASGYDAVGVREVAGAAGVNAALVNRYFGSKLGLFRAAVAESFTVGNLLVGERATLGERLARYLVGRRRGGFDPTLVVLRSAASPEAGPVLRAALDAQVVQPLAVWLGGADAHERAGLVVAALFGIAAARDVLGVGALAADRADALAPPLAPFLQRLIDGG